MHACAMVLGGLCWCECVCMHVLWCWVDCAGVSVCACMCVLWC